MFKIPVIDHMNLYWDHVAMKYYKIYVVNKATIYHIAHFDIINQVLGCQHLSHGSFYTMVEQKILELLYSYK